MNDKIVYVIEAGEYSDRYIMAVTMDKEKAEWMERRYGSVSDPVHVIEYVLDADIPEELDELHPVYKVIVDNKGQIKSVRVDHYTNETNYQTHGEFLRGPYYRDTLYELYFNGYCTARDEEHAKKIIKDFRSKKLSEELGL